MNTQEKPYVLPGKTDSNTAMLRLERNNQNLSFLREKLSSYVCEPRTLKLFERKEMLKDRLEGMCSSNQELINSLKKRTMLFTDPMEIIREQRQALLELEQNVLDYIGLAKVH